MNIMYEIPPRVRITYKITYEIVWTDGFKDPTQLGECCPHAKQIKIKNGLKPRKAFYTYVHELYHAINFEKELNLTENQVDELEDSMARIAKLNKGLYFR